LVAAYIQYWIQGVGAQNKLHLPHKTHDLLHNTTQHNLYDTSVSQVPCCQHDLEKAKSSTTPTSIDIHDFNINHAFSINFSNLTQQFSNYGINVLWFRFLF
jgi:hypothetical protein